MPAHLERARLLLATHRPMDAERVAREGLTESPQSRELMHALCSALGEQDKIAEARMAAQQLVAMAPDWPDSYYMLTSVELAAKKYRLAADAAAGALRLAPDSVIAHHNLAVCQLKLDQWDEALRSAEAGLALDAEHSGCANIRSLALNHFGRKIESLHSAQTALRQNPQNSNTHFTAGLVKLQAGDAQGALDHFVEALRLDPGNESAREGLIEAMKARNPVYRALLKYSFWMMRLSPGRRRAVIFGGVIGYNLVQGIPGLGIWSTVIMVAYVGFVMLSWVGSTFFNFILMLDRRGRQALVARQKWAATGLIVCLTLALAWFTVGLTTDAFEPIWAMGLLLYAIPLTRVFNQRTGWRLVAGIAITVVLGLMLVGGLLLVVWRIDANLALITACGLVAYMWLGSLLLDR